jgi:hypothetical protein
MRTIVFLLLMLLMAVPVSGSTSWYDPEGQRPQNVGVTITDIQGVDFCCKVNNPEVCYYSTGITGSFVLDYHPATYATFEYWDWCGRPDIVTVLANDNQSTVSSFSGIHIIVSEYNGDYAVNIYDSSDSVRYFQGTNVDGSGCFNVYTTQYFPDICRALSVTKIMGWGGYATATPIYLANVIIGPPIKSPKYDLTIFAVMGDGWQTTYSLWDLMALSYNWLQDINNSGDE